MRIPAMWQALAVVTTLGWLEAASAQTSMSYVELNMGEHRIEAEVAATDSKRSFGLMYRSSLGSDSGMVFIFRAPVSLCMWMKNTLIPLSVAFIDSEGRIINMEDMTPQSEETHCSRKPARYALEVNQGWFRQRAIQVGDKVDGLLSLPPGQ